MAGHETQTAFLGPRLAPLEIVLNFRRLPVLVRAEKTDVQVEPRILKVVRVAAIESDLLLGREDDTPVRVALEPVEGIAAALIQRDHVATLAGLVLGFLLDRRHD